MVGDRDNTASRSAMNTAMMTRLLGMTVTLFVLILTVKQDLLEYPIIAWQLVLSIPLLFASLVVTSKIVNESEFKHHKFFTLLINSISIALVSNTIGLLVTKYVSFAIGVAYFLLFVGLYFYFLIKDLRLQGKIWNELVVILISLSLGLAPTLFNL